MFVVKNIINSVQSKPLETALVVCQGKNQYAIDLCKVFKRVFFYNHFSDLNIPNNASVIHNANAAVLQTSFDVIISLDGGRSDDISHELSNKLHIPFIQIVHASDFVGVTRPFSTPRPNLNDHHPTIQISMYSSVNSSSGICIPNIKNDINSPEKDLDYIGLFNIPEPFMGRYIGLLNEYSLKIIDSPTPTCGMLIDPWLGNSFRLMDALSYGTVVICPRTPESERLITEGKNGFLYKDFRELSKLIRYIYSNKGFIEKMSSAVTSLYSEATIGQEKFIDEWKDVIKNISRRL